MEHKTWTTMDKASWGPGPWQDEPDKEQFTDEATGLPCLIKRSWSSGALCGYVGVPAGHPWHGKDYDSVDAGVHGGLTYAGSCQEGPEGETICHVPGPGEPDGIWWLGFDCAHAWDIAPAMAARMSTLGFPGRPSLPGYPDEIYRTAGYVKAECASLAAQAAAAAKVSAS